MWQWDSSLADRGDCKEVEMELEEEEGGGGEGAKEDEMRLK